MQDDKSRSKGPFLLIAPEAHQQLKAIMAYEVSMYLGFAEVVAVEGGYFLKSIVIPRQDSRPACATISDDDMAAMTLEYIAAGGKEDLKGLFRSQGPFQIYWSATDKENIEQMFLSGSSFCVSLIGNAKEIKARLDIFQSERQTVYPLPIRTCPLFPEQDEEVTRSILLELARKTYREKPVMGWIVAQG